MVAIRKDLEAQSVKELRRGVKGQLIGFTDDQIAKQLMSMGIIPGSKISFVRQAPFGGGCYIKADGLMIALRSEEAASILLR